jgi:RNA polymerase sigma factor (sigma-70 family)
VVSCVSQAKSGSQRRPESTHARASEARPRAPLWSAPKRYGGGTSRIRVVHVLRSVHGIRNEYRTDEQLLASAAQDSEAFALFYRRHVERVLRYFLARAAGPEQAADLMAETFAAAYIAVGRFRPGPEPPVAWLFTIAQRKLIDAHRRGRVAERARRRLALEPLILDDDDLARIDELAHAYGVEALLHGLSAAERDAVIARVVDGRSYADIAVELNCSPLVVRQRVSRGLRRVRKNFEGGTA